MKRIVSLLLTLCLLGVLSVSAASNSPALTYRTSGDNVELTLEGVAQSVTALQVTLELDGSCPDASFTPASGASAPAGPPAPPKPPPQRPAPPAV